MNREKLQDWALLAEIVGGVAILATLIILILETRESNELQKAATHDALVADIANWRIIQVTDNEVSEVMYTARIEGPENLAPLQSRLFRQYNIALFQHYERAFLQWRLGNLDDVSWERFRFRLCGDSGDPYFEETIGDALDNMTNEDFTQYRKTEC